MSANANVPLASSLEKRIPLMFLPLYGRFIFISVVYKTLPEPSWFPNTTGIGLAAAKVFLYWTIGKYCLFTCIEEICNGTTIHLMTSYTVNTQEDTALAYSLSSHFSSSILLHFIESTPMKK